MQQIVRSGQELMAGPRLSGGIAGQGIRPLDGKEAAAAVRTKKEKKQDAVPPANLLQNFKRLALIGRYLRVGVMAGGVETQRRQGTPQGGPLSPLLSNILLDDLDKELERRGHAFRRYADDCNV